MRITREDAEAFFAHPSQRKGAQGDQPLSDAMFYYAQGPVCFGFHWMPWPGVLSAHLGVKPEAWGKATEAARAVLTEVWHAEKPTRIIAWNLESNRAIQAFCRRIGAKLDGRLELPDPVMMYGWSP